MCTKRYVYSFKVHVCTVKCRYNAVQFITILFMALRWQEQNLHQTSNPQRARYGVSVVRIFGKIDRHDDVIKWKHFPRYWPFVSPVNSPHKGQWRGALMFCLIRAWINSWVNNCEAGDLRRYLAHCDVIVMRFNGTALCRVLSCFSLVWHWSISHIRGCYTGRPHDRLLHSRSLVRYETWLPIGWHQPFWLVGLNKDWDCLNRKALWARVTDGNFHIFPRPQH